MSSARINRLTLTNFRSYRVASVSPDAQMVVLTGPNGSGKTNMLELLHLAAVGVEVRQRRTQVHHPSLGQ
jgi:DNA replication and repair protein RecF